MHEPPRLVHLTTAHPALDNRIFRKECAALKSAGYDVHLVAVTPADQIIDDISIHALPQRNGRLARMALGPVAAWRVLKDLQPDLVHVHDPELIPLAIAWRASRRSRVVYDAHEELSKQIAGKTYVPRPLRPLLAWLGRRLERLADRHLDGIVTATPTIHAQYENANKALVQNFPWRQSFDVVAPMPTAGRPTLAYVGAINEGRGLRTMLDARRKSRYNPRLIVAGIATDDVAEELARHGDEGIEYLGVVDVSQIPDVLARSHVGLCVLHPLPNYLTAQSTKLYEYMASARPFVASRFPSWVQQLGPYDCGIFVDPLDVTEVSAAIDELLRDTKSAAHMGDRGRMALEAHFSFEAEAASLVGQVARLLEPPNSAGPSRRS